MAAAAVCTACCVLALTACSDDTTGDDSRLPDGEYPMAFTAAVDGLTVTRAGTADEKWTTTDRIAVQVSDAESGNGIKIYAPSGNGNNVTLTSDDPFYWQSKDETKTVSAWYCGDGSTALDQPNAGKVPTSWSVQPDQDKGDGYQESDFLYAAPKSIQFSSTDKSLEFTHQTARVVINIKNAEAATETSSITKVTIGYNNLALSGTYIAPTEGNATGTWNTSGGTGTITPKDITAAEGDEGVLKTYAALVIPQNMSEKVNQKFIAVSLMDGNTYYYTPQNTDADLKSGTQYTYNITVKYGYLEVVTVKTDVEWGGGDETTTSVTSVQTFTENDLKIGDYFYRTNEGGWTTSDGGLRKIYPNGSIEMDNIGPVTDGSTCIGIVYWVGDPTKITPANEKADISNKANLQGDATLATDHPGCTHGLVVSLDEVTCAWQVNYTSVQDWLDSQHPDDFLSVHSGTGANDPLNNIQGYNNTKAIEAFNASSDNSGNQVYVVQQVVEYRDKVLAPDASSGWYVPSEKELTLLCGKDVDNIYTNNSDGIANRDLINRKLALIGGATPLSSSSRYWSSAESSDVYAFDVRFGDGYVLNYFKNDYSYRLRFSFAF